MKRTTGFLFLTLAIAACNKMPDSGNPSGADSPLKGYYSNEINSNTCDEYVQVLSFDDNILYDVDLFAGNSDDILVNTVPFTVQYSQANEEGMIVPLGHDYIDSIYFFKDDHSDKLVSLIFRDGAEFPDDSLQLFVKDELFEDFIKEQKEAQGIYVSQPSNIGPENEQEIDTTADVGMDADFVVSDENTTKVLPGALAAGKWLGMTFLSTTVSYGVTHYYNALFDEEDTTTVSNERKLNEILVQTKEMNLKLDSITKKLKELDAKFERKAATDKIEKRNAMYTAIHDVNYRYYNMLKDLRKDPKLVSDTTRLNEAIAPIINKWGNTSVDGSPAYTSLKRVVNMIVDNVSGRNLFQIYDLFVFNTHFWESDGYVDRDDLRISDFGMVAECCFLTKLFYTINKEKVMLDENDKYIQKFIDFYNKNQVVRNNDKHICQIAGAHLVLEEKARRITYENPTWLNNVKDIVVGNRDDRMKVSESLLLFGSQAQKFLKPEEAKAIVSAYGNKENLESILVKHGLCQKINASKVYIPLSSGHKFAFPNTGYYDQHNMPGWMDINVCTINSANPNCYTQKLGRIKFKGEKGWIKKRLIFIKRTIFDTWHLSYDGWESQSTTGDWWNYDVIKRYQ